MSNVNDVSRPADAAHSLAQRLARIVSDANVETDPHELAYLSRDFFYWNDAGMAEIAVSPGSVEEVQAVVREVLAAGRELVIRGGGMSTGRSYVPTTAQAVILDTRRLDRIREVNLEDRYAVVEAGCTWSQVVERLEADGMRPDFTVPMSGNVSTVGGAMAHNVTGGMKGILGLEVVRANGDLVHTGSWGRAEHGRPYYRDYGPDLTGLFLGDTGAFGVKTAVSLHISRRPEASAYASFSFDSLTAATRAMVALSHLDFLTMRTGLDPTLTRNALDVSTTDAVKTLGRIAKSQGSLVAGAREVVRVALAGRSALAEAGWSVHVRCDQLTRQAAEAGIETARKLCLREGRELPASLAVGLGANRLTVRGSLNKEGKRWIATNSVWPLSRGEESCRLLTKFLDERADAFRDHGVELGCFMSSSGMHFQLEPLFWWSDTVSELALRHIDRTEAERFRSIPENPRTREFITRTRFELRDAFEAAGAIHVHTSKFFRYAELLEPGTRTLLADLKRTLDPGGTLNQRNLGL